MSTNWDMGGSFEHQETPLYCEGQAVVGVALGGCGGSILRDSQPLNRCGPGPWAASAGAGQDSAVCPDCTQCTLEQGHGYSLCGTHTYWACTAHGHTLTHVCARVLKVSVQVPVHTCTHTCTQSRARESTLMGAQGESAWGGGACSRGYPGWGGCPGMESALNGGGTRERRCRG